MEGKVSASSRLLWWLKARARQEVENSHKNFIFPFLYIQCKVQSEWREREKLSSSCVIYKGKKQEISPDLATLNESGIRAIYTHALIKIAEWCVP